MRLWGLTAVFLLFILVNTGWILAYLRRIHHEQNHLHQYINRIDMLIYRDALTGIQNRWAYQETVSRLNEQIRAKKARFAVLSLDINGLKRINDTRGHDYGDLLIIHSGKILRKVFQDLSVYRIGGDEFVVILEGVEYEERRGRLEKLERQLAHAEECSADERVSLAYGLAVAEPETDSSFTNVFRRADRAMYEKKQQMRLLQK